MTARAGDHPVAPPSREALRGLVLRYAFGVALVAVAFGLRKLLEPVTGTGAPFVLFFGAVVGTSLWAGPGPGICATSLSLVLGAYVFVVRAGFTYSQAATQAALFAVDGLVVVYLSTAVVRARRLAETSELRQRDLIELAPDAFFLADLEGRFTDVNHRACQLLGYEREELIGKTIADIIPPEDLPRLEKVRAALLEPGQVDRSEWRQRRKDGTIVPVEVSANILPGGRWQAFARDISERKRIEDERQVFVSLLDNSSDFIGIADPTGRPIYVNPAGRRMVGLPADYPVEETAIVDYYPPEERAFASDVIVKSMAEHGRWSGETHFRHWQTQRAIPVSDEHFTILDPSGQRMLGMGTVTRDISEARRAARELRESEERFRLTIEEAPIGMALVALDGRFVRINAALCEIVGYTVEELQRLRFQDITHPDDLDTDLALVRRLIAGEIPRYQLEKRYIRKDGQIVTIMLSASLLRGADGTPLYAIAQIEDITERKLVEAARRLSESRFSGIISISADAIISVDEDQRISLFNDGAERIFGYARAEAVGAPLDILLPERFRSVHRQHIAAFMAGPTASRRMGERVTTLMGRRKNGEEFPAEAAISKLEMGDHTILTVALRDVTARKRVEEEQRFLAEAGAVLASSLDYEQTLTAVGQLTVRDLADWCIVDLLERENHPRRLKVISARESQAALATQLEQLRLDWSLPSLAGRVLDTRRPFMLEHVAPDTLASFSQSEEHLRILRAIDPRSIIGVPLAVHGHLLGVLTLISSRPSRSFKQEDLRLAEALAERVGLAIENGRLYQTAVHATQLRDEVLGVVAHDLRNPVAAIALAAAVLQHRAPGADDHRRTVESILRATSRMNRLIGDLLDVSLIEAGHLGIERARVSTRQLLAESAEVQRQLAASSALELRLELAEDLPDVWGDQHRLLQVLENLIGNAIKFTPAQGRITVGAAPREGEVLFWVADTGCGISSDGLPHVFDRFWQARKGERRGGGLGLPITRGIVEAHGGRVWVESTLGRGTVFFFTIPEAPAHAETRPSETMH